MLTRPGDKVRFNIANVFLPDTEGILVVAPDESVLEGTLVNFSDSGDQGQAFAIVDVVRKHTFVVPTDKLQLVSPGEANVVKGKGRYKTD